MHTYTYVPWCSAERSTLCGDRLAPRYYPTFEEHTAWLQLADTSMSTGRGTDRERHRQGEAQLPLPEALR